MTKSHSQILPGAGSEPRFQSYLLHLEGTKPNAHQSCWGGWREGGQVLTLSAGNLALHGGPLTQTGQRADEHPSKAPIWATLPHPALCSAGQGSADVQALLEDPE